MFFTIYAFVLLSFYGTLVAVENNAAQEYEREWSEEHPRKRAIDPYVFDKEDYNDN